MSPATAPVRTHGDLLLSVRDLHVTFPGHTRKEIGTRAVVGVDFDVHAGEILALVGESGCGKSATALAVMGLHGPDVKITGSVEFDGVPMVGRPERELNRLRGKQLSMIFQDPLTALNPVITVEKQLVEVLMRHEDLGRKEARDRSVDLLRQVGIPDPQKRIKDYPHQLSGGMRQRVMIAIAMACNPHLLIADEPTTALDTTIQAEILDLILELATERAMALLLITHDLGVVAQTAHRVAVMYAGRIVEQAGRYEIFDQPRHRYTRGLLKSTPTLVGEARDRLDTIPGSAFDAEPWDQGCAFAPRCDFAIPACQASQLDLVPVGAGGEHLLRCANPAEGAEQ
ncbi:MAG: ABC transporter ATP-binding protein [Bifidobacteriaceae bacterium]|jgi:peptide/nickel transport system ATP-binding protein|nr:ABC transporter ATP-binding protein [Bifidobacteriaceae bacterium]